MKIFRNNCLENNLEKVTKKINFYHILSGKKNIFYINLSFNFNNINNIKDFTNGNGN